jgi:exoribonuclease R
MGRRLEVDEPAPDVLAEDFARIRGQFGVTVEFTPELEHDAAQAARRGLPTDGRADMRDVEFFTVDPPRSMDLDQAMHLSQTSDGYRVRYAIADIGNFVERGGPLEQEAWRRGLTAYSPDRRALLYPAALSEDAASLLPGVDRPAIVFTIDLDSEGRRTAARIEPAIVRSRQRFDYSGLHRSGHQLLETIGKLREQIERERGGVRLPGSRQAVRRHRHHPAGYHLVWERRVASEDWNAQISLLAGFAAAALMLEHGTGLLRTMAGIDEYRLAALRRTSRALHVDWPAGMSYADFVRGLDPGSPHQAALIEEAHGVMGHAGFTAFAGDPPANPSHAALASPYAQCTAPMRRLADRYVLELLCDEYAGREPSAEAVEKLTLLPAAMEQAEARNDQLALAIVDDVEARFLEHRVGDEFTAVVVDIDRRGARVQLADPPVRARMREQPMPPLGEPVCVRLQAADPLARSLQFVHCSAAGAVP